MTRLRESLARHRRLAIDTSLVSAYYALLGAYPNLEWDRGKAAPGVFANDLFPAASTLVLDELL